MSSSMQVELESNKIFGIGISRTGTTSLGVALLYLGIPTTHYVTRPELYHDARAILDAPVFADFERLDHQFPRSRFIYTQRDPDAWLHSFRDKLLDGPMNQREETRRPQHEAAVMNQRVYRDLFGRIDGLSDDVLREGYLRHRERVFGYFLGRPNDLLVLTIDEEDNQTMWSRLCEFVGIRIPGAFPVFPNQTARLWDQIHHPCKVT